MEATHATEVLDDAPALELFSDDDVTRMLDEWDARQIAVAQLVELRAMRVQLATFAQLGEMMAQLGAGGGGMLGKLLGFGG